jgi:tetratricopeptide (TPR) repeat protein
MVCIEDCSLEGKMLARLRAALVGLAPLASVIAFASIDPAVRPQSPISTLKRLEYTKGYIGLGLIKEASAELDAIDGDDRMSVEVLRVRIDLYMEAKRWNMVVKMAGHLTVTVPADEQIWISWAYALRELQFIKDAEGVLLRAEKDFGHKSAILHYNLACYSCLLGYFDEANKRLKRAVRLDKRFEDAWADDADLKGLLDIF